MATRRPIIIVAGQEQEITVPDTIDPAVLPPTTGTKTFAFYIG